MVDNRSAGISGFSGGINFKSGDISGTAAKTADDRASQGTEYFLQEGEEQTKQNDNFADRSMQLKASLNSLALLNVVSLLRSKRRFNITGTNKNTAKPKVKRVEKIENNDNQQQDEQNEQK